MRQADLLDGRAGRLERGHRLADAGLDAGLHPGHEVLARAGRAACHGAPPAASSSEDGRAARVAGHRLGRRGRVAIVATGDRVEQRRRVAGVAGERPDLVERAGERDDAVAADPAVGRLHPDDPAQRRRLADRAAGVGADRERRVEGRHRRRRAAAAAARHAVERPRVGRRAVGRVLGGRAHRELVHVGLAEDHRARLAQPLGDVGVVRGDVALEDPRARRALAAGDRHEVLERDRDPEQRMEPVERVGRVRASGGESGVGGVGLGERPLAVDGQPGVERPVVALGGGEVRLGQLARRRSRRARRSAAISWACRRVRSVIGLVSARRGSPGRR